MLTQLKKDHLESRKQRNTLKSNLLGTVIAEAVMIGKNDGNRETTESEILAVIKKFLKGINESIESLKKQGRDTSEIEKEKVILESYMPSQLSEEKLTIIINELVDALPEKNMKQMGKVMGEIKKKYDGQFDGKLASSLVKSALN